jgi:protocatechuate 3,4-dioxygenase beta subunit
MTLSPDARFNEILANVPPDMTRRVLLRGVGSALALAPLAPLLGCSSSSESSPIDGSVGTEGGADASTTNADTSSGWATGGTAAMRDKASYPNPFATGLPATCALTCEATQGPCYSAQSETIQDISYGYSGLPTRVYLQVLNDSCQPVPGAVVDVWHVSAVGKYSGNDAVNENVGFCTGNDSDFTSHLYFRGMQTSDANGVVFFDTCYPGWYTGRTVHIHLSVRIDDVNSVTTQLFFADSLNDDILTSQALYNSRGARATTNQNDSVVSAAAVGDYTFQTQKMTEGALLAWKTLVVRSSQASGLCQIPGGSAGGGGPMADGGPPGPGGG